MENRAESTIYVYIYIHIHIYLFIYPYNIYNIYIYTYRIGLGIMLPEADPGTVYESLGTAAKELMGWQMSLIESSLVWWSL